MTGTIKTLVKDKNFGFITAEGFEKDLFFHMNSLSGVEFTELNQGDTVSFDVEDGEKGKSAVNVTRA